MTFHKGLHTYRTLEIVQVQLTEEAKKRRFAGLLQSTLTDSNRRPPLYEEGPWVKWFADVYCPVTADVDVVGGGLGSSLSPPRWGGQG